MRQPQTSTKPIEFNPLDAELWLVGRLRDHIAQVFTGATDPDIRRERIRRCIVNAELGDIVLGKHGGKPENYSQAFERLYGQPLQPKQPKGKKHVELE